MTDFGKILCSPNGANGIVSRMKPTRSIIKYFVWGTCIVCVHHNQPTFLRPISPGIWTVPCEEPVPLPWKNSCPATSPWVRWTNRSSTCPCRQQQVVIKEHVRINKRPLRCSSAGELDDGMGRPRTVTYIITFLSLRRTTFDITRVFQLAYSTHEYVLVIRSLLYRIHYNTLTDRETCPRAGARLSNRIRQITININ